MEAFNDIETIQHVANETAHMASLLASSIQALQQAAPPLPPPPMKENDKQTITVLYASSYDGDHRDKCSIHNNLITLVRWDSAGRSMMRNYQQLVVTRKIHREEVSEDGTTRAHFNIQLFNTKSDHNSGVIHINVIKNQTTMAGRWRYAGFSTGGIRPNETENRDIFFV